MTLWTIHPKEAAMADRRQHGVEWRGRGQEPTRGTRRDVTERGRDMGRSGDWRDEDRGLGRGYREEDRDRGRFGGGEPGDQPHRGT